ncbi:hypothetical protein LZ32DRAFT_593960 [Colletotrichum eremochloae]|nr:hypothetical protein LZ32DRAFT_593960 [Colletotrichum eremochloae]
MAPNTDQNVLIPIKLDAFVFNAAVCNGGFGDDELRAKTAKIAPISQPNYSFLRLNESYLQSDILYHVDLHNACPAEFNSRITDLGARVRRENRQGVYLHWTLPRLYRSGAAATSDAKSDSKGLPVFPEVPTRWLVVRHIHDLNSVEPAAARSKLQAVSAWVVESDRCRTLDGERNPIDDTLKEPWNILQDSLDLQVDVSPFVSASDSADEGDVLQKQAEIFIGDKAPASKWKETQPRDGRKDKKKSRVDLRLLDSSNELFPDYQPHNSNVFSILDNFEYDQVVVGTDKKPLYAERVSASYTVIGWYSKPKSDIVQPRILRREERKPGDPADKKQTRAQRLAELDMDFKGFHPRPAQFDDIVPLEIAEWLDENLPRQLCTLSLCHGAMYDVRWDSKSTPAHVLADRYAALLNQTLPLAIGSTPMDALMAYAGAHENMDSGVAKRMEAALKRLETLLLSRDDGVEAHAQAADMMYNWNYSRMDGGERYHIDGSRDKSGGGKPMIPKAKQDELAKLNRECRFRDAARRKLKRQRWALFAEWWQAVTLSKSDGEVKDALDPILESIKDLEEQLLHNERVMADLTGDKDGGNEFQPGIHAPFFQQRDPTLLVGGVRSGWEPDYLHTLLIRLDCQLSKDTQNPLPDEVKDGWDILFRDFVEKKMPDRLQASTRALLREFVLLHVPASTPDPTPEKPKRQPIAPEIPTFHDTLGLDFKGDPAWRDFWNNTQPWFPLFLEWEVEYTHIEHEDWELAESRWWHSEGAKLHYAIKPDRDLGGKYGDKTKLEVDTRRFSGRVLLLPQPSFSIEAKILQLFNDTPCEDLERLVPCKERKGFLDSLRKFDFLSAPLSGFTSHMLTVEQGNHVKPSVRDPISGTMKFLTEAERKDAGLGRTVLPKMDMETDLTPYGSSKKAPPSGAPAAFKPVTHGQFRITKLNIIDKFGQAIHAIDPKPATEELTPKLYPCISDWYAPQAQDKRPKYPNVVSKLKEEDDQDACEYVQVPPQINQPARLNAVFAVPSNTSPSTQNARTKPFWRAAYDWDQPIWGWVVVNYANFGVQFFLPSGAFYREVRCAGPTGALKSPEWLPFAKPDPPKDRGGDEDGGAAAKQLARLVQTLACSPAYLRNFIATVNAATTTQAPAPSAYAEFRSALVGRPLALTHAGWSLELAGPAMQSQLAGDTPSKKALYPSPPVKSAAADANDAPEYYSFPLKLGDKERGFDGLVGYFLPLDRAKPGTGLKEGDALDLATFYTHFSPASHLNAGAELAKLTPPTATAENTQDPCPGMPNPKVVDIVPSNYPVLRPYYIDPDIQSASGLSPTGYDDATNAELSVVGALVDPFLPVHAYTGILPVGELRLPAWTWQVALDRLSAFFHTGPVLVAKDVPDFDPAKELKQGQLPPKVVKDHLDDKDKRTGVALPGGALGHWSWLQPYGHQEGGVPKPNAAGEDDGEATEKFMPLPVELVDDSARLEKGPYTALEGYLQMAAAPNEGHKS